MLTNADAARALLGPDRPESEPPEYWQCAPCRAVWCETDDLERPVVDDPHEDDDRSAPLCPDCDQPCEPFEPPTAEELFAHVRECGNDNIEPDETRAPSYSRHRAGAWIPTWTFHAFEPEEY